MEIYPIIDIQKAIFIKPRRATTHAVTLRFAEDVAEYIKIMQSSPKLHIHTIKRQ